MRRSFISIAGALLLALLLAAPLRAHANLVRTEPAVGAVLQAPPKELVFEFTEALDPGFSRVQLFDSQSQLLNAGPGALDPADPKIMRLALQDLPKGSYTAIWRSRSAVDGHISEGSLPFGVGVPANTASLIPPPGAPDPATETPPPLDSAARWLTYVCLAIALGGLSFALLVWRPAVARARGDRIDLPAADTAMTSAIRSLTAGGSLALILASGLFLFSQAAIAAGVPFGQALGGPALQLLGSRTGQLILARIVLAILVALMAWWLPPAGRGPAWPWWIALLLGAGAILTVSLNAHAAAEAQGTLLAIAADWLHIAAMVAWLGGLLPLLIALRAARRTPEQAVPLAVLIPRFSWVSAPCVALLTLTGIYAYLLHIDRLDLLAATTYGRALLIKLGLFSLLFLLGAINLLILSRRLRASGNRLARAFGRSVRIEVLLGLVLLLAAGAMTSVAPSETAWEEHERLGLVQEASVGDVGLVLWVAPAQIGDNEFAVDVTDRRPGAQDAPAQVLLRFDMQGMAMGDLQAETQTTDKQRYTTRGSYTSMGGRWNVEVVLRRDGFDDVRHTFQMDIVRSAAQAQ